MLNNKKSEYSSSKNDPNTNLNPNPNTNLNPNTNTNPNMDLHINLIMNPNMDLNQNPITIPYTNPNINPNINLKLHPDRFTGETGTILKVIKSNDGGASRAMVLTDMSSKELEVRYSPCGGLVN